MVRKKKERKEVIHEKVGVVDVWVMVCRKKRRPSHPKRKERRRNRFLQSA